MGTENLLFFKLVHKYLAGAPCMHTHTCTQGCRPWASHAKLKFNFIDIFSCYLKNYLLDIILFTCKYDEPCKLHLVMCGYTCSFVCSFCYAL